MTRLGGEFHELGDGKPTGLEWEARQAFLQAIRKFVPDVLRMLHEDVLPRYIEARPVPNPLYYMDDDREALLIYLQGKPLNPLRQPEQLSPPFERLRDSLFAWADRFHLLEEWLLDTALDTLARWHYNPSNAGNDWGIGRYPLWDRLEMRPVNRDLSQGAEREFEEYVTDPKYAPGEFVFKRVGWICYTELRSEYEKWALVAFEEELKHYLDEIERAAEGREWKRTPTFRGRKAEPKASFEMLARWQCGDVQSKKQLIRDGGYTLHVDSVDDRLRQAAKIVGIGLRRGRNGRPRNP